MPNCGTGGKLRFTPENQSIRDAKLPSMERQVGRQLPSPKKKEKKTRFHRAGRLTLYKEGFCHA